ncbi:putative polyketide synthase [Pyrenochaeta sp. MPI-SDFR-AT-0127]|nr:putative polyketide synthase [Pyrenochaeta sp. MPI-SDFR-AT-0127]
MNKTFSNPNPASTVLIFGPQALSFQQDSFAKLCSQLHEPENQWLLNTVSGLSKSWTALSKNVPILQHLDGQALLEELAIGLQTGELGKLQFPLPNILLSPLVVVTHLTQYSAFIKAGLPDLADTVEFPSTLLESTEVLGLCTGILAGIAVNCSSSISQLQHHGANAVRLGMAAGALVDAEQASPDSEEATSLSVSWSGSESIASMEKLLIEFPTAYESVSVDEKRSTITTSKHTAHRLVEELRSNGFHVTEVALSGRFHWRQHQEGAEQLVHFCDSDAQFQFPQISDLALSHRAKGRHAPTDRLHIIALHAILTEKSEWLGLFSTTYTSHITADAKVIVFGPERCLPPTIARKLGSRLVHISQTDLSTSSIPRVLRCNVVPDDHVAVIGMSCHVPGASDLSEFWEVLASGQSQHIEVPSSRFGMETAWRNVAKGRKWYGNFMDNHDTFDHKFFKKSPREMESTDPQHRIILQLAYQAVEQSGYFGASSNAIDKHIGCYIGIGNVEYDRNIGCYPANAYSATGNLRSFVAGKVSHYFGWTGPSMSVDTACSSSIVAIHNACRAILHGECTTALAGGVNVLTSPEWFHNLAGAAFLSQTGQCKPFDAKGDGYCRGEGAGVVYLKKLSSALADGDQVLGVIASSRVYQNQNSTAITVPNADSLSQLFVDVLQQSKLEPQDISVVEAHGTGTPVGDPAEYDGIRRVFGGSARSDLLSLSSVKGSLGHTEFASGVLSLLKVLLMMNARAIPPQASFSTISPGLKATPEDKIEIPTRLKTWEVDFCAALINNYGASGSNASMVVTEAPKLDIRTLSPQSPSTKSFPFWFCGSNNQAIEAYIYKFRKFLQHGANTLKDFSAANLSFQVSRQSNRTLPQALILSANSPAELDKKLLAFEKGDKSITAIQQQPARPVILCFGGQISTHIGLDKDVYEHVAVLRNHLDDCNTICISLGIGSIYPQMFQRSPIEDTVKLQTALFAIQYSCAKTWIDSGIKVAALVGHSFGELTALCVGGVLTLEDALRLISGRARLIQNSWGTDRGSMLAVEADLADVHALLLKSKIPTEDLGNVSIACYNGPKTFTLAGPSKAVQVMEGLVKNCPEFSNIKMKKLNVTNAFHSTLVEALMDDLRTLGQELAFNEPTIRIERATQQASTQRLESSYPAKHMREPVFFDHAIHRLAKEFPAAIWLEAGSNSTVTTMASRALGNPLSSHFQSVNITSDRSFQFIVDITTRLWTEGLNVSFWGHHAIQASEYRPLLLPPYQFEKSRHWMELKSPFIEKPLQPETPKTPKGLTTFLGYQNEEHRRARFQVNTSTDKLQRLARANVLVDNVAVMPGMLQLQIVLDALKSLRPDLEELGFQPELQGMSHQNYFVADCLEPVYLDTVNIDEAGLVWGWKLSTVGLEGVPHDYTTGKIIFRSANDPERRERFDYLARLSGRERCVTLLEGIGADEVLSNRNIYRAFEQVVNYKAPYRCLKKIVAKECESAGRVVRAYDGEAWIDPVLTESFCQVAGIYVNIMTTATTELSERGVFICDKIDRWMRNLRVDSSSALPEIWEVFAVHHQYSEDQFISDVFAFDPRDGSLVEAILGISHRRVPIHGICETISRSGQVGTHVVNGTISKIPPHAEASNALKTASIPTPVHLENSRETNAKATKSSRPEIASKTREIVCNLSGLELNDIADDSDLVEIGIDSLMAMELVREVQHAFKYTLQTDELMTLTDFRSLVECIRSCLSSDAQHETCKSDGLPGKEQESQLKSNGFSSQINHVNITDSYNGITGTNGMNGVTTNNGYLTPPTDDAGLPTPIVRDTFSQIKWSTDDFITKGQLANYYSMVMPRSTELCVVYIVNAFDELGCNIRSAVPGQQLERVHYLPKHQQFMDLIYGLLEQEARLIDIDGLIITRTSVAVPTKSAEILLAELLRDEPVHAAEHKLTALIGPQFADCLTGKADCLQIMFGTPTGREIITDMYANSPITGIWIQQLVYFLEELIRKLPKDGNPLCILEMGAGTGGTTGKLVPILARLGVPIVYTMTDISGSLVATARKRFKKYPFMKFEVLNIESEPTAKLLESQHIILATNCVHATRNLSISLQNIHRILRPDGFLMLLEMTEQVPWVDFIFGLVEGWWLFEDDRDYVLQPAEYWEKKLHSVGFGHVDWTQGQLREASLQRLIIAYASGPRLPRYDRCPELSVPPTLQDNALTDITERQAVIDALVEKYTKDFSVSSLPRTSSVSLLPSKRCVLVTGATGSLGSHVVAYLAQLPAVDKVFCLNRVSTVGADERQQRSLEMRGIMLAPASMSKLNVVTTDTSKPNLGLSPEKYRELVLRVTDIVHSAWPMSLTRPIRAYAAQFSVFRNLVEFARDAAEHRPAAFKFGFQFISSLAVVANYPQMTGNALVPEKPTSVESVPAGGYADAKLACEHILSKTLYAHLDRFHPMVVRIAQISGSTTNGYWNPTEYMPFLIKSSQVLRILPKLTGTLSWYPVNGVAATLGELLMSPNASNFTYHIDNPSRQPWEEIISILASALDIPTASIVPYDQWIDRVKRFRGSTKDNPALQLIDFFDNYFVPMSCGGLMLDTSRTFEVSHTLRTMGPIGSKLVKMYIDAWKQSGFLNT